MNKEQDDIKQNACHIRIIIYLLEIYPNKAKTVYEIVQKHFKKGNTTSHHKAKEELINYGYIIEDAEGFTINPKNKRFKPLLELNKKRRDNIIEHLKRNEKAWLGLLINKNSQRVFETTGKMT